MQVSKEYQMIVEGLKQLSLTINCRLLSPMQLEQLEAKRAEVLNEKAFCIQCCWRRFKQKKLEKERRSATLIQAGNLTRVWLGIMQQVAFQLHWVLKEEEWIC